MENPKRRAPPKKKVQSQEPPVEVIAIVEEPPKIEEPVVQSGGVPVQSLGSQSLEPSHKDKIKPESSISKMNDSFVFVDNIYRSRMTLLDILEERGYDVEKYRKFSPAEATAAYSSFPSLSFKVQKKEDPTQVCDVRYANITRQRLDTFFDDIEDDDSERTEVIVIMSNPVLEAHHHAALKQYTKPKSTDTNEVVRRKLRVSFFSVYMLVVNPLKHVLVPKHELVPEEKHKELMASLYVTSKSKFPEIKFHIDPIARCIGAVPGDIVKITRPSQSSGESVIYRVCAK